MEVFLKRIGNRLAPMYASDEEAIKKLPIDDILKVKISRPRNVMHHRKFFALVNLVYQNQEKYESIEDLRKVLTLKAGFYTTIVTDKGTIYSPKSISFSKMSQDEFESLYSKFIDVAIKEIGVDHDQLMAELENFM